MLYIEPDPEDHSYYGHLPTLELTRRNLEMLLLKLDDPASKKTIIDKDDRIRVRAVENEAHYADRAPGLMYMPSSGEVL